MHVVILRLLFGRLARVALIYIGHFRQPFQGDFFAFIKSLAVETWGSFFEEVRGGAFVFAALRCFLYLSSWTLCAN